MRATWRASIAVGVAVVLAGCQSTDLRALDGTQWRVVMVADISTLPARPPMITFKSGGASGFAVCSAFTIGRVTVDTAVNPARLGFGDLSIQGSQCTNQALQRLDTTFVDALTQAQTIGLDGAGRLVLGGPGGRIVFERVPGSS